jgi:hypothetical protein
MFRVMLLTVLIVTTVMFKSSFAADPATGDSASAGRASGRLGADWRYVHYRGKHWYWMPDASWRIWTGTGWAVPDPGIATGPPEYRRFSSTPSNSEMQRTFSPMSSSSPMGSSGGSQGGAGPAMGNEHFLNR